MTELDEDGEKKGTYVPEELRGFGHRMATKEELYAKYKSEKDEKITQRRRRVIWLLKNQSKLNLN